MLHTAPNLTGIRLSQAKDSGTCREAEAAEEAANSKLWGNGVRPGKTFQGRRGRARRIWTDEDESGGKLELGGQLHGAEFRELVCEAFEDLE